MELLKQSLIFPIQSYTRKVGVTQKMVIAVMNLFVSDHAILIDATMSDLALLVIIAIETPRRTGRYGTTRFHLSSCLKTV